MKQSNTKYSHDTETRKQQLILEGTRRNLPWTGRRPLSILFPPNLSKSTVISSNTARQERLPNPPECTLRPWHATYKSTRAPNMKAQTKRDSRHTNWRDSFFQHWLSPAHSPYQKIHKRNASRTEICNRSWPMQSTRKSNQPNRIRPATNITSRNCGIMSCPVSLASTMSFTLRGCDNAGQLRVIMKDQVPIPFFCGMCRTNSIGPVDGPTPTLPGRSSRHTHVAPSS